MNSTQNGKFMGQMESPLGNPKEENCEVDLTLGRFYVKVLGRGGRCIYCETIEDIKRAVQELGSLGPLTVAYEIFSADISAGHMTVTFLGSSDPSSPKFNSQFVECINNICGFLEKYHGELQATAYGKSKFGPNSVILLKFDKELFHDLQIVSKLGLREGPTDLRKHHFSVFFDESNESRKLFIEQLLPSLKEMSEEEIAQFLEETMF